MGGGQRQRHRRRGRHPRPRLVRELTDGIDVVFHQAAIRITQCAEEPRLALEVLVDGTFNVVEAAADAGVRKLIAASSASVYGLAEQFPTAEDHHPYANDTLYGAAKVFNEGLLRSFHAMTGLDYVALRYFNVYGPRMDVHGVYTEVLVRWMERIAAGEPPLIFGDGAQTMDFVFVARHRPRERARRRGGRHRRRLQRRQRDRDEPARAGRDAAARDGLRPRRSSTARSARVNGVTRRLADTAAARERLGFEAEVDLEEGLTRLVEWWRADRADGRFEPVAAAGEDRVMEVPFARPRFVRRRGRGGRRGDRVRLGLPGPARAGVRGAPSPSASAPPTRSRRRTARPRCTSRSTSSGVGPGDEVIVPSLSFIATANAVWQCGATPVFADVDPRTYNLDPAAAERAITPRTKAIMPVHQIGLPADMDAFLALAERHGLAIVEDAACAIGATYKGRPIGSLGPLACFSLHPRKVITCGEGGMIAVHDAEVAERLRRLRQHAMDLSDLARHGASDVVFEYYPERGWNARMTDMQAALGLCQLDAARRDPRRAPARWPSATPRRSAAIPAIEARTSPTTPSAPGSPMRCGSPPDAPVGRTELMRAAAARRRRHAARRDGDPPRARLRRAPTCCCPTPRPRPATSLMLPLFPGLERRAAGPRHRPAVAAHRRARAA